ncbi:hypothetical protein BDA96_06G047600 [Sorghum bicolor]|uniref:Uncharacterized protein n=2 Tax=Sorghum bicolor TaxID=4558 RepID=A0A921UC34_SORBI|nr:hypothetical protein BDA96_06G047600 [Sorghum bicolor]KXG26033.1 hypothetical protein SORBI_3006G043300 [Sorghum bicolor]
MVDTAVVDLAYGQRSVAQLQLQHDINRARVGQRIEAPAGKTRQLRRAKPTRNNSYKVGGDGIVARIEETKQLHGWRR